MASAPYPADPSAHGWRNPLATARSDAPDEVAEDRGEALSVLCEGAPGVIAVPHPELDGGLASPSSTDYWFAPAGFNPAITALTICAWPLSVPLVALVLGWTRTNALLTYAVLAPRNDADPAHDSKLRAFRYRHWSLFAAATVTFGAAVTCLVALLTTQSAPTATDASPAASAYHMAWMQCVATGLVVLSRRLAFVGELTWMSRATSTEPTPSALVLNAILYYPISNVALSLGYGIDLMGAGRGEPVLVLTRDGYDALRRVLATGGGTLLLPPVEAVRRTCADGVLRLPTGEAALVCATAAPVVSGAPPSSVSAAAASVAVGARRAAELEVQRADRVALDWSFAGPALTLGYLIAPARVYVQTLVAHTAVGLLAAVVPFIIRAAFTVPPLGSTSLEAAVFILVCATEVILAVSVMHHYRPGGFSLMIMAWAAAGTFRWLASATQPPPRRATRAHDGTAPAPATSTDRVRVVPARVGLESLAPQISYPNLFRVVGAFSSTRAAHDACMPLDTVAATLRTRPDSASRLPRVAWRPHDVRNSAITATAKRPAVRGVDGSQVQSRETGASREPQVRATFCLPSTHRRRRLEVRQQTGSPGARRRGRARGRRARYRLRGAGQPAAARVEAS